MSNVESFCCPSLGSATRNRNRWPQSVNDWILDRCMSSDFHRHVEHSVKNCKHLRIYWRSGDRLSGRAGVNPSIPTFCFEIYEPYAHFWREATLLEKLLSPGERHQEVSPSPPCIPPTRSLICWSVYEEIRTTIGNRNYWNMRRMSRRLKNVHAELLEITYFFVLCCGFPFLNMKTCVARNWPDEVFLWLPIRPDRSPVNMSTFTSISVKTSR